MPDKDQGQAKTEQRRCECNDDQCQLEVTLLVTEARQIRNNDAIIIVDGCLTGPSQNDLLLEQRKGYSIYAPGLG